MREREREMREQERELGREKERERVGEVPDDGEHRLAHLVAP